MTVPPELTDLMPSPEFLRSLLLAILLSAAFALAARALAWLRARAGAWLEDGSGGAWVPSLRIQRVELVSAARVRKALRGAAALLHYACLLLLTLYGYLPLLFGLFPGTRGWSDVLLSRLMSPVLRVLLACVAYVPNMLFIAVVVAFVHYALKLLRLVFEEAHAGRLSLPGFYPDWARPTFQLIRVVAWALALVVVFPYLPGSQSPAFKAVSVFAGILISFGSGSSISNVAAGVILVYMRAFREGDRVSIGQTTGDVVDRDLLVTRLRTIKNEEITIPNSQVLSGHIVNYSALSAGRGLILHVEVTIGYDVPWRRVHELLLAAAAATEGVLREPAPFVLQAGLEDSYVRYELNAYTDRPADMVRTASDLRRDILDSFHGAGVEIMSPSFHAVRDGNRKALPPAGPELRVARKPEAA